MPCTAKVFMTNRSQAVRLPKDYQFSTDEVFIRRDGDDIILSPKPRDWRTYFESSTTPAASGVSRGRQRSVFSCAAAVARSEA
jgi:antitoxin VapB